MKISVIIPTYKPQAYLWECLDSVVAQTFPKEDFELILVLNGCTEPWKSQIQEYMDSKMKGMNVKFIHTEQGGVSNARNMALDVAEGDYITFIDDDDFVSCNYLEGLYEKASLDTITLCYPYAFIDGHPETQLPYGVTSEYHSICRKGRMPYYVVRRYFGGPWMKLIPRCYIGHRRFDVRFRNGEDSLFMFLISDCFNYIAATGMDCKYYRRYREDSAYTMKHSRLYILKNSCLMSWVYTRVFFSKPFNYSFRLYVIRLLGVMKTIIKNK